MSRKIILAAMAAAIMLAGCENPFVQEHKVGLIGAGVGAGIGGLAGSAIGHNTTSTLIGAAVGGGIGYLLGNTQDKKRAESYNPATPTPLTGTQWRVTSLNMPNPPAYRDMYLTFAPNSELVTTQVLPNGQVTTAAERYRIADHTLIINRPAQGNAAGYIINANYTQTDGTMTITSPEFSANLQRVEQIQGPGQAQSPLPYSTPRP